MSILSAEFDLEVAKRVWAEEGREEGREEGEKIGKSVKALEIAKNLLKMGLAKEQVSQGTGLSIGEIAAIESSL